jgi:hypothetical protein
VLHVAARCAAEAREIWQPLPGARGMKAGDWVWATLGKPAGGGKEKWAAAWSGGLLATWLDLPNVDSWLPHPHRIIRRRSNIGIRTHSIGARHPLEENARHFGYHKGSVLSLWDAGWRRRAPQTRHLKLSHLSRFVLDQRNRWPKGPRFVFAPRARSNVAEYGDRRWIALHNSFARHLRG